MQRTGRSEASATGPASSPQLPLRAQPGNTGDQTRSSLPGHSCGTLPRVATSAQAQPAVVCLLSSDPILTSEFQNICYVRGLQLHQLRRKFGPHASELPESIVYAIDSQFDPADPTSVVADVLSARPGARILVVAPEFDRSAIFPMLSMGVRGLLRRREVHDQLGAAIEAIGGGGFWIPRALLSAFIDSVIASVRRTRFALGRADLDELDENVLDALLEHRSDIEIAKDLNLTVEHAHQRIAELLRKFGVRRRADLLLLGYAQGG